MHTAGLTRLVAQLENDRTLDEPDQFRRRMEALELLDRESPDWNSGLDERADAVRTRLEAANSALFDSVRAEILRGADPGSILEKILRLAGPYESEMPAPGLGYDHLDDLFSGVLELREPDGDAERLGPEMVFYQPTPARHVLRLVEAAGLTGDDVFVDLGSGLGHVALMVSILTGARTVGVEIEAGYIAVARECAERLEARRVRFVREDARTAGLSEGTVFYLYTPFTGGMLAEVLVRLRQRSAARAIRICTLGPCALVVAREGWLRATGETDPEQISVFYSS